MHVDALPNNNPAELRAFDEVCERLAGFNPDLNFEWMDGFMTALHAGPQVPPQEEWLPALCGDAFERAFADPPAHTEALRALKARMAVLREQLDPGALMDDPGQLRLAPLMAEWSEEDRQRLVAEQKLAPEDVHLLATGAVWAEGFLDAVIHFQGLWPEPQDDNPEASLYDLSWAQLEALVHGSETPEFQQHLAEFYPEGAPPRDDLVTAALYAVQDLRLWWVDNAPRPATRRVEQAPGRNDPCPCGSGRKYKKCHGAAGA